MNKHRAFCRKAAAEGMILLKNDNNILPLDKNKQIAVFGRSQYLTAKSGEGSGNVCGVEVVSLADGLKNAGANLCKELFDFGYNWHIENGFKGISYAHEIYKNDASIPEIPYCDKMIENAACKAETAVVIFTRRSGENVDIVPKKGDYYLSDDEINLLKRVKQAFKNTVLLLNYGERYDLSDILDINPDSILYVSQGGQEIGNAIADVIFGDVTPSGKLTGTWAKSYKDHPSSEGFGEETAIYKEGIYVGYRYFDTFNIEPVYPFGYGLSYTEFSFDDCHAFLEGDKCTVALSVTNVGKYKGKEVVEVYVSKPDGKIENAYQDLAAFDKTKLLLPGETERLAVTFSILDLTGYCSERESYVLQAGEYYVRVGNSSRNTHIALCIEVDEDIIVKKVKNLFRCKTDFEVLSKKDVKPYSYLTEASEKAFVNKVKFDASDVVATTADYNRKLQIPDKPDYTVTLDDVSSGKATVAQLVACMTPYERLCICNGNTNAGKVEAGVIGSMAKSVKGAAAETYEFLKYKIPKNICADGPAGIRLMSTGEDFREVPETDERKKLTAYPISTCIASSWDKQLSTEFGRNVAEEMEDFGIDGWLAPGMSIQRNPLCGRNFEYYSEDPLLSASIASAETIGVQIKENGEKSGKYVTLKHIALNNQEAYRCTGSSEIDERTFREIYLRNFEITVKMSAPLALMSSYNMINGVYASVNRELLTDVIRSEWDFKGIVMSDWGANGDPAKKLWAGNDLNMPGNIIDEMKPAYEKGLISDYDIFVCACRVVDFIKNTSYLTYNR